jgi:hypothetical protein
VPRQRTGIVIIGVLLAASGLAFLRAEQLKLERSPVAGTRLQKYFSTTCPVHPHTLCTSHSATLRFRLRAAARVAITDSSGRIVRHLTAVSGPPLPPGRVTIRWNGRTDRGATAPDGTYHLQVDLVPLHRVIDIPDPIDLDNTRPTLTLAGRAGVLPVRYRLSEPARVYALARTNGERSALFRGRRGHIHFRRSRLGGAEVRLTLTAVDRAGNPSPPVAAGSIRLPA